MATAKKNTRPRSVAPDAKSAPKAAKKRPASVVKPRRTQSVGSQKEEARPKTGRAVAPSVSRSVEAFSPARRPNALTPPGPLVAPPAQPHFAPPPRFSPLVLIGVVIGLALAIAGLVALTHPRVPDGGSAATQPTGIMSVVAERAPFVSWLNRWREEDEYLRVSEFRLAASWPLDSTSSMRAETAADRESPRRSRLSFSPSGERFADWMGVPEVLVSRLLIADGGEVFPAASKSTPDYYQEGFWIDETMFAALGTEAARQPDGRQLCLGEGEGRTCYQRLTVEIVDLAARRRDVYLSEKHAYRADPFADGQRRRVLSSMTDLERVAVGVIAPGLPRERFEGAVTSRDDNGQVIMSGADGPVVAALLPTTSIADEEGKTATESFVRRGVRFLVDGVRDDVGRLVLVSMSAVEVPPVMIYSPDDAVLAGVPVQVRAIARAGIASVRVQLKSGVVLLAEETVGFAEDSEPWHAVAVGLQPSRELRAGEAVRLFVFDDADPTKGETVSLKVN